MRAALHSWNFLLQKSIIFVLIAVLGFYDISPLFKWPFSPPQLPEVSAADEYAIRVESFDRDVTADGSTFTLTNDVGDVNNAFIKFNAGTRKTSAGPTGSTANAAPNVGTVGLQLTGTNQVTVRRADSTEVKVMGEVWRYLGPSGGQHEFIVRGREQVSLSGSTASVVISGINDPDKVIPFITGYTVSGGSVNDWNAASIAAHIDDSGNLVVSRNNTGVAAVVYVDVVEFTGSAWTVCHGYSNNHDTAPQTITLNTDSDGQGGSSCDIGDWGTASIIEATMEGDSSETGLSDTLALVRPGPNTSSVEFDLQQDTGARNDGEAWIHVLQHDNIQVNRASNANAAEGNGTYSTESWPAGAATTVPLSLLSLEWYTDTSGVGTAHMRGGLNARIRNLSEITYADNDLVPSTDYDSTNVGVFNATLSFAASPQGVVYEAGGTGTGSFVGFNDSGNFVIRAGNGGSVTPADAARIEITPSDYNFASRSGTLAWEFNPDTESVSLSFDEGSNSSIDYATSTTAASPWADWSGGDDGGVGTSNGSLAGSEITSTFDFNGTITEVTYSQDGGAGQITHWIHRSGNNVGVEYGVIDLSGLTFDNTFFGFDTLVTASSTHITTAAIPSNDVYVGGSFVIQEGSGSRNVTNITISEAGTIDGSTGISNIELRYEESTTAPYDCSEHTYDGTEAQFGSTDTNGFSGPNGSASFSDSVQITTTKALCVYPVLTVTDEAVDGDTIILQITNPAADVITTGGGSVGNPVTPQAIAGSTTVQNAELTLTHYRWLADDGLEGLATALEAEDTPAIGFSAGNTRRLRLQVNADGSTGSLGEEFRLEYATSTGSCSAASLWEDVGANGGAWDMTDSTFIINGTNATNIAPGSGGVSDPPGQSFETANTGLRDTNSQTGTVTLASNEFTEFEFAVAPTLSAVEGTTYCFRLSDNGTELRNYDVFPEGTVSADFEASALGSHNASVDAGTTNQYLGGAFSIVRPSGNNQNLQSLTITETGTIDAETQLNNIEIWYDEDESAPYDCTSESYDGNETQFGVTDTNGFSAPNGSSTFSGSVSVRSNRAFCGYVVVDVAASAPNEQTIKFEITNPSQDVVISGFSVAPSTPITPTASTTVAGPVLVQTGYHWRLDDAGEAGASSATGGSENTLLSDVARNTTYRLRYQIDNEGTVASPATQYRLEYGTKITTCEAVGNWQRIDEGVSFTMATTSELIEGGDTTDVSSGGMQNPSGQSFQSTNGGQRETSDTTAGVTLSATQFTELEYAIEATDASGYDTNYCFRLTDAGEELARYGTYAELLTREKQDFVVQRGTLYVTGTGVTLTAGTDYIAPENSNSAFVRITNTNYTGAGHSVQGTQNADDVTAYISDQSDLTSDFTISRPSTAVNSTRVSWELVEYIGIPDADNEIIVRDTGAVTYGSGNITVSGSAISGIADDSDVVVFITGQVSPSTATNQYSQMQSTAEWDSGNDIPIFTRGQTGTAVGVSYAVVEFTGLNWKIQRVEHTYAADGVIESENIAPVNSLNRSFLHAQKRIRGTATGLDDFGHVVAQNSIGSVTFRLDGGADVPSDHSSVAWVIENTQTGDGAMKVLRSGNSVDLDETIEPRVTTFSLSPESLNNLSNISIFGTNDSTGSGTAFPRAILGLTATSTSAFEVFESDAGQTQTFSVMMMQWPVAELVYEQNYYQLYVDNDTLTPTDPWPVGAADLGENTPLTAADEPLSEGERIRIRMSVGVNNVSLPENTVSFKLQYALRDGLSCDSVSSWTDLGDPGSGSIWRGYNASPVDGATLPSVLLSISDIPGSYNELNPSATNPNGADIGEDVEYDWIVEHNGANQRSFYCFRMVQNDDTELVAYNHYPTVRTTGYTPVINTWRWYDDINNETPVSPLATEEETPVNVDLDDTLALRVNVTEVENASGANIKFYIEYSEYPDFRDGGTILNASANCIGGDLWCYTDGPVADNTIIQTAVLSNSDSCSSGTGSGCGSHNSSATTSSSVAHAANTTTEFSFTLKQAGARVNTVYYFRLVDAGTEDPLIASSTYPSVQTSGSSATVTSDGLDPGTMVDGYMLDATTTPTTVVFGNVPFDTELEAAQRFSFDINSTEGYRVYVYADQQPTNVYGDVIPAVANPNSSPAGWSSACATPQTGCFGYHSGDDVLSEANGSSVRFAPDDSFAAFSTTPEEVFYSNVPGAAVHDIVYKMQIGDQQPAGNYQSSLTYIVVPAF